MGRLNSLDGGEAHMDNDKSHNVVDEFLQNKSFVKMGHRLTSDSCIMSTCQCFVGTVSSRQLGTTWLIVAYGCNIPKMLKLKRQLKDY